MYQPKVDSASGRVVATEALLRCHEPVLAQYPIEEVIGLAMEAGLIEQLDLWVMLTDCQQTRQWHAAGLPHLKVCVNACASEMADPAFPARVSITLASCGLAPECLDLEITERELFDSGKTGRAILAYLRERGVMIALDDFGTGYSSLSYLTDLLVDLIKLDKSFSRNIPQNTQDCTVAASILRLAHGLDLKVVAEGVETAEQVEFFRRERCDMMQGFFFCRPLPVEAMTPWLLERGNVNLLPTPRHGTSQQLLRHPD